MFLNDFQVPIPMTEGLDPISMLTDGATIAQWNNEGLPGDKISTQNATILTNCERWPLLIDPQLQGIKWLKSRYGNSLKVINLSQKGWEIDEHTAEITSHKLWHNVKIMTV